MSENKRALVVVNYSEFMKPNARESMIDAAHRWKCAYMEFNEQGPPKWPDRAPAAMKTTVFRTTDFDDVFILDADVIVSGCCPNPFEVFGNPEEFIAVKDCSPPQCQAESWQRHVSKRPDLDCPLDHSKYFNSGMMLARRKFHEEMMNFACDICRQNFEDSWNDQTPIQIASILKKVNVRLVDERWNFLCVERFPDFMNIGKHPEGPYCLHGAGNPARERWLHEVKWQCE